MVMSINAAVVSDNAITGSRRDTNSNTFVNGVFAGNQGITVMAASAGSNFDIATGGVATLIDGETPVAGDNYLLKDQTNPLENGIYVAAAGTWTRNEAYDIRVAANDSGLVYVAAGTANEGSYWQQTAVSPVVGVNALTYVNPWAVTAVTTEQLISTKLASVAVSSGEIVALNPSVNNAVVLNDSTVNTSTTYRAYAIVVTGASSGSNCEVATGGEITLASNVFLTADIGKNIWASQTTPGAYTLTAPVTVNKYKVLIGTVSAQNKIQLNLGQIAELVQA